MTLVAKIVFSWRPWQTWLSLTRILGDRSDFVYALLTQVWRPNGSWSSSSTKSSLVRKNGILRRSSLPWPHCWRRYASYFPSAHPWLCPMNRTTSNPKIISCTTWHIARWDAISWVRLSKQVWYAGPFRSAIIVKLVLWSLNVIIKFPESVTIL